MNKKGAPGDITDSPAVIPSNFIQMHEYVYCYYNHVKYCYYPKKPFHNNLILGLIHLYKRLIPPRVIKIIECMSGKKIMK